MSSSVYSQVLYEGNELSGIDATWTVPAGYVAVIRDIAAFTESSGTTTGGVVLSATPSDAFILYEGTPAGQATYVHWEGRQVVDEGETVSIEVYGDSGTRIRVCGYLLTLS